MSDIYHIPNDDGKTYRLKKFVEYQHEAASTDCPFVAQYCRDEKMDENDIVNMAFVLSATYSEITTAFLAELSKTMSFDEAFERHGSLLNFGSARKHMKLNGRFQILMKDWQYYVNSGLYDFVKANESANPETTYKRIQAQIMKINEVGRFASDLFLELLVLMKSDLNLNIKEPAALDWKNCSNLTSGTYNIFYEDEKANEYDRTGVVTDMEKKYLTLKIKQIQKEIARTYPEQSAEVSVFVGKICSFRNLFKGARYGGFHHDRQLGVLRNYETLFPEYDYVWKHCYEIRKAIYPNKLLGELNGWDGIRKERKRLWLTKGLTGVE